MLCKESQEVIESLLENTLRDIKPTYLHLKHQMELPLENRVTPLTEKELGESVKALAVRIMELEDTLKDYQNLVYGK